MSEALFLVYEVVEDYNADTIKARVDTVWNIPQTFLTFTNLPQEPGS